MRLKKTFLSVLACLLLIIMAGCATKRPLPSPSAPTLSPEQSIPQSAAPSQAPSPSPTKERTFAELAPTTKMEFAELVGDNGIDEIPEKFPEKGTYKIVIDIYHQVVIAYSKDASGGYTVPERYMLCTTGSEETPTPIGTYEAEDDRVRFQKFQIDDVYAQYWTQITGEIYFHSILYSAEDASEYTVGSYEKLGTRDSHGCIRLLVPDARWIFYHIAPGTEIEIREGSADDSVCAKIKEQLTIAPLPEERPKLEPGKAPQTDTWSIEELKKSLG